MTSIRRLLPVLAAAVMLFTLATGSASARIISFEERSFRVHWSSLERGGPGTIRCRVTLEGSFHSMTIPKVARSLIGAISRAIFGHPCTGGEAWADNGTETQPLGRAPNRLPWHLTYENFVSNLPAITALQFLITRVSIVLEATVLGFNCRGRYGRPEDNISVVTTREGGGGAGTMAPVEGRNRISLVEQLGRNAVCGATSSVAGTSNTVANLTTGGRIIITLI